MTSTSHKSFSMQSLIPVIILFCCAYWGYLLFSSEMLIKADATGYEALGKRIVNQGLESYFNQGVEREPLYPFIISISMKLALLWNIDYKFVQAFLQLLSLLLCQILIYRILKQLNVRPGIIGLSLLYWGISPTIINTALSLFSEIASFAFVLGILLIISSALKNFYNQQSLLKSAYQGSVFAILFLGLTAVKAISEFIFPLFILPIIWILIQAMCQKKNALQNTCLIFLLLSCTIFEGGILAYKMVNKHYNHTFAITDRGSWALYGNTARRMLPLNQKRFLSGLAYIPGEGFCKTYFDEQSCTDWSYKASDEFGFTQLSIQEHKIPNEHVTGDELNSRLMKLTKQEVLKNPLQWIALTSLEGLKMFFWESTKIGYVTYPAWLTQLYDTNLFKNGLRLLISFLSLFGFFLCVGLVIRNKLKPIQLAFILWFMIIFIAIYSPFFIITRYASVIASLFIICCAYAFNALWGHFINKDHALHSIGSSKALPKK